MDGRLIYEAADKAEAEEVAGPGIRTHKELAVTEGFVSVKGKAAVPI